MPVILENGSDQIRTWLDPKRSEWTKELQSLLRPYEGELECYAVSKEVGKVGNNSPDFIVPVASSQNKSNIANFFANTNKPGKAKTGEKDPKSLYEENPAGEETEKRKTVDEPRTEDNAPVPVPSSKLELASQKRDREDDQVSSPPSKVSKTEAAEAEAKKSPAKDQQSPVKSPMTKKMRSATSNGTSAKTSPVKGGNGSQKITNFFKK